MRGGLTLAEHLANRNGQPTLAAKALAGLLALTAAAAGYALGPSEDPPRERKVATVQASRFAGELPAPARATALELRTAAPVPELQDGRRAVVSARPEPALATTPVPTPTATPEPTPTAPAATPEPVPAPPAPVVTPVPARPSPTPAESFDLSG